MAEQIGKVPEFFADEGQQHDNVRACSSQAQRADKPVEDKRVRCLRVSADGASVETAVRVRVSAAVAVRTLVGPHLLHESQRAGTNDMDRERGSTNQN